MKKEIIFLIGYMGSGKTTIGNLLAKTWGWHFIDTDHIIEAQEQKPCSEIMRTKGETYFRLLEQAALEQATQKPKTIVATGGGLPCFGNNMERINNFGTSFFLNWTVDNLATRLEMTDISLRPMLQGKNGEQLRAHIAAQLQIRLPFYRQAKYNVDCNGTTENEVVQKIKELYHPKKNDF